MRILLPILHLLAANTFAKTFAATIFLVAIPTMTILMDMDMAQRMGKVNNIITLPNSLIHLLETAVLMPHCIIFTYYNVLSFTKREDISNIAALRYKAASRSGDVQEKSHSLFKR